MPADIGAAERFVLANARLLDRHRLAALIHGAPVTPVLDAYAVRCPLRFLDSVPDEQRADDAIERLRPRLGPDGGVDEPSGARAPVTGRMPMAG